MEVAKGSTGAAAYRKAYNTSAKPKTQGNQAHKLSSRPDISAEIEAYQLAIEGAKHRNPAALRELVIQSLVKVIIDPDSKPGQITAAAKVLGTVTEVAAFTERKEVRTITSSEDARAAIMAQLKQLSNASAEDAHIIDAQADDMTKQEQKQIDRATAQGRGALLRTLAIIHRAGSTRTQKQITTMIDEAGAQDEFTMVNGALLHKTEGTAALLNN